MLILIAEVKKPHFPMVEDKVALGQLFGYMGIILSYSGQSLREWRVVWLPDCRSTIVSELAAMSELPIDQEQNSTVTLFHLRQSYISP